VLLNVEDDLPRRPLRILVVGAPGAGKRTLASRIAGVVGAVRAARRAVPRARLDHEGRVRGRCAGVQARAWITEWRYGVVRPLLVARADLLV